MKNTPKNIRKEKTRRLIDGLVDEVTFLREKICQLVDCSRPIIMVQTTQDVKKDLQDENSQPTHLNEHNP